MSAALVAGGLYLAANRVSAAQAAGKQAALNELLINTVAQDYAKRSGLIVTAKPQPPVRPATLPLDGPRIEAL